MAADSDDEDYQYEQVPAEDFRTPGRSISAKMVNVQIDCIERGVKSG